MSTIPVICDRCSLSGIAGQDDFSSLGDLLNFAAVPRQLKRKDGWTAILQREFIARLAQSGSATLAVEAMGKNLHGVKKLLKDPGSDGFRAAWERAVEMGEAADARRRIAEQADLQQQGAAVASAGSANRRGWQPEPEPEEEEDTPELRLELIERLIAKWQRKVGQERDARIAGEVVAADFYLRQVTVLEVAFDLMIDGHGDKPWIMLMKVRRGERNMLAIADTYMARVLDQARRDQWAAMAEPERPLVWPERYVIGDANRVDARIEPLETVGKTSRPPAGFDPDVWHMMDPTEQRQMRDEQHRQDAEEQVAWEAASQAEAAEWRARQSREEETKT